MPRDLKSRIQENIKNYKKPTDLEELSAVQLKAFEILNKKAAPKKQLTLSEKKLNKAIAILLRK
jgi:hypothetical protein